MLGLIKRNLKLFFKDAGAVLFSVFGVLIVLLLYVFFLGDMIASESREQLGNMAKPFVFAWVFSGMVAIGSFTSTFAAFSSMITDKANKIDKDLLASPLPRWQINGSYLIAATVIGVTMSIVVLVFSLIYLAVLGMSAYSFLAILKIVGLLILSTLSNTAFLLFISIFIKSSQAFGALTAIFSATLGFFTGTFVQIGIMPKAVQGFIKVLPVSHSAVLFRKEMMQPFFDGPKFEGAPAEIIKEVRTKTGIDFYFGDKLFPEWGSILILIAVFVIFAALTIIVMRKKKK